MELPDVGNRSRNVDARCQREYDCWNNGARWEYEIETCIVDDADGSRSETTLDHNTIMGNSFYAPHTGGQNVDYSSSAFLHAETGYSLNDESAAAGYDPAQDLYPSEPVVYYDSSSYYLAESLPFTVVEMYSPSPDYNSAESGSDSSRRGFAFPPEQLSQYAAPGLDEYSSQTTVPEAAFAYFDY